MYVFAQPANNDSSPVDTLQPESTNQTDDRALKLLIADPVYTENWINDVTFVFENIKATDLPETTIIPLLQPDEKFTPTWYGKLSSAYKWRWGRQHHGVDLGLKTGDPIFAAWDGVVRYARWNKAGYGNCVIIRHKNGLETLYAHLSKISVSPNQYVSSGDVIGLGGSTGRSYGPHLHFEIRYKDFSINPELIIDYNTQTLRADTFQFVKAYLKGSRYGGDMNIRVDTTTEQLASAGNIVGKDTLISGTGHPPIILHPSNASPELASNQRVSSNASVEQKTVSRSPLPTTKKKGTTTKKITKTYTIKKGDTYTSIAKKTGVSIASLKKLNPRQKETLLMPGKTIRIR
jgi:murein DD-endopeptidase MepM/ murein hydrolase activator NlpD